MTADWIHELFNQFDLQWNLAHGPSLETLTDEEYLWEPVPGCWSIRPTGPGGRGEFEAWPDPEPAPVTTIAWRLSHLAVGVFGLRASHYFGDGSLTHANAERPLTAKEGVAYFKEQALQWRSHVERLDEEGLARPVGEPEHAPVASLVLHVNREALHHLAEVSLLRDLYRATGGTRLVHPSPHVRPSEDQGLGMAPNTLSFMTIQSGRTARQLCAAADEALTEAAFRSGEFTEAERLFGEARTLAGRDGDREAEALAVGGLGMTLHHRNIAKLVGGNAPADADVAAEEELMRRALAIWEEIGDPAGTARALFGVGLVFQVLRRDWASAMPYFWRSFGLAEAVEESGDLYGRSEIHRHLGACSLGGFRTPSRVSARPRRRCPRRPSALEILMVASPSTWRPHGR